MVNIFVIRFNWEGLIQRAVHITVLSLLHAPHADTQYKKSRPGYLSMLHGKQ